MDKDEAIESLNNLRKQAYQLTSKSALGEDFELWLKNAVTTIQDIFGVNSSELSEFKKINFKTDPGIVRRQKYRVETLIRQFGIRTQKDFEIPQDHYYYERLYDAAELMLAMIVGLKSP